MMPPPHGLASPPLPLQQTPPHVLAAATARADAAIGADSPMSPRSSFAATVSNFYYRAQPSGDGWMPVDQLCELLCAAARSCAMPLSGAHAAMLCEQADDGATGWANVHTMLAASSFQRYFSSLQARSTPGGASVPPLSPRGRMHSFTNTTSSSEYDGSVVGDIRAEAAERALFERMVRDADEQAKKARAGLQELDRRESEEAAARTRRESEEEAARTRREDERREWEASLEQRIAATLRETVASSVSETVHNALATSRANQGLTREAVEAHAAATQRQTDLERQHQASVDDLEARHTAEMANLRVQMEAMKAAATERDALKMEMMKNGGDGGGGGGGGLLSGLFGGGDGGGGGGGGRDEADVEAEVEARVAARVAEAERALAEKHGDELEQLRHQMAVAEGELKARRAAETRARMELAGAPHE